MKKNQQKIAIPLIILLLVGFAYLANGSYHFLGSFLYTQYSANNGVNTLAGYQTYCSALRSDSAVGIFQVPNGTTIVSGTAVVSTPRSGAQADQPVHFFTADVSELYGSTTYSDCRADIINNIYTYPAGCQRPPYLVVQLDSDYSGYGDGACSVTYTVSLQFPVTCTPINPPLCSSWGPCESGQQQSVCSDGCGSTTTQSQSCTTGSPPGSPSSPPPQPGTSTDPNMIYYIIAAVAIIGGAVFVRYR